MRDMLAMYVNVKHDNWTEILPFIQLAHNTAYNKTLEEARHVLMFGRRASLPVDFILGVPCTFGSETRLEYPVAQLKFCNSRTNLLVAILRSVTRSNPNLMRNGLFRNISLGIKC